MTALVFVDTNVFVYRHDRSDPAKQARAEEWIAHLARSRTGRLSFQVLQELYVTLTGKTRSGFDPLEVREIVRDLGVWQPAAIDLKILERAWHIQDGHSVSWWDSVIVAAAQSLGCSILLTEDLGHGHAFGEVRVVNPFRSIGTPGEIVAAGGR
ncbi:MAG: PIN domain-containing protein [Gemmatimonadetes bacterium]|nr:PIN domain-containing protein [Gemmatimonadota bacterium]MYB97982.1 PIN domain-containing protein [Gemmatimonadota bacterium]MYI46583.1 PIN domain-containing protein [Gemmatimonadota bacterium]